MKLIKSNQVNKISKLIKPNQVNKSITSIKFLKLVKSNKVHKSCVYQAFSFFCLFLRSIVIEGVRTVFSYFLSVY